MTLRFVLVVYIL